MNKILSVISTLVILTVCNAKNTMASTAGVTCTMNITTTALGPYNPLTGTAVNVTNGVYVTCSSTTANSSVGYTVNFSGGNSGTNSPRQLLSGANVLNYRTYSDSSRTMEFVTGVACTTNYVISAANGSQSQFCYTYYTILGGQTTAYPGSYSDTLAITINY